MKTLLSKAKKDLNKEKEINALAIIKGSLKRVKSCEKTLKMLKGGHAILMETNIDDLELDEYEY